MALSEHMAVIALLQRTGKILCVGGGGKGVCVKNISLRRKQNCSGSKF